MTAARQASFFVPARPAPKGSWKPVPIPKKGKAGSIYKKDFTTRLLPNNKRSEPFQKAVALFARMAWKGDPIPRDVAVQVRILFTFRRPDCHYFTKGGEADRTRIRPDAAAFPIAANQFGDVDKLLRNVMDGLSQICYIDDAQVISGPPLKVFGEHEGALVSVKEVFTIDDVE